MLQIAQQLQGQLTITIAATNEDVHLNIDIINIVKDKCGRLLFNGMPTGVEVVYAMHHGGPYPSTTDAFHICWIRCCEAICSPNNFPELAG